MIKPKQYSQDAAFINAVLERMLPAASFSHFPIIDVYPVECRMIQPVDCPR